ncbi:MAG TPA: 1,4-alpha-glucan branching protein GlgB, partial [Ktedonobacterales bacterium]|nr:1,4-alpha-glucan branching protein GlgB [Ktedonobacterales bacterium]
MGKTPTVTNTTRAPLSDPLDPRAIAALVAGRHGAPFDVLGPRSARLDGRSVWIVRAFLPGAQAVSVVPETPDAKPLPMRVLHPAGLFSLIVPGEVAPAYRLDVQRQSGVTERIADPYTFPPLLTEYDLYLMGEGTHQDLYHRLGAHPRQIGETHGVAFAVWAPDARRVSVVGDFNGWDQRAHPMRMRPNGVWELFLPDVQPGALYKYAILSWNRDYQELKADPFAFYAEVRPGTASRVWDLDGYAWGDADWLRDRPQRNAPDAPIAVYELHVGSWRPAPADGRRVSYRELAHQLVPYVKELGYTHIELMPIAEHPFDGSWGYQVTGYYAPTSRYGEPQDFMYFVDYCHQHDIGVFIDWVPAHFPKDAHGLAYFDGTHLYEHDDPRLGEHPDWGTYVFNYGRNEVRNFLIANALFWLDVYHVDGLRVDAVASMLYLDYSRKEGQWIPNQHGGRENLTAIDFIRQCNATVAERFPGALMIAEESTAWPGVTHPIADGGLGFAFKWNMGWMHDTLEYFKRDPLYRKYHQSELTFAMMYAYSERFLLPFSHDEVVHMKGSMLNKAPGDRWQKFANLRALYAFMYGHPGKKLLFMGGEFGQWGEWNFAGFLDWALLDENTADGALHRQLRRLVGDLNALLRAHPALYARDSQPDGFEWIDGSDTQHSVVSFMRYGADRSDPLLFVCNFT